MKDWKYITYLALLGGLLALLLLTKNKQYDWTVTFSHEDKNPYGGFAFNELLPTLHNKPVKNSYQTLYELQDSLDQNQNLIIIGSRFAPGKADTEALLKYVNQGGTAFISANYFFGSFADTLGLEVYDVLFKNTQKVFNNTDTASLHFVTPVMDSVFEFRYKQGNIHNYISRADSIPATTLIKNNYHQPVAIKTQWGKGTLLINSTPMIFTNIHLLDSNNHTLAAGLLSYLPPRETIWTEFYHLGRFESTSPLRFVLSSEPLRWAYYLTILSILLFMIFEAKRKQRTIPILKPLANTSLEFIGTIGNLYYQNGDHKNIAEKKIQFFFEQVRMHQNINLHHTDEATLQFLIRKSGVSEKTVRALISCIQSIRSKEQISADELRNLNQLIENFHNKI
ncbi:MAG: hypothetical protein BroJett042_27080 [Bacteroidota bacterium]|nr:MAG: hypothetical protein BroJett042_27080 [Bacteroidota bacterium]